MDRAGIAPAALKTATRTKSGYSCLFSANGTIIGVLLHAADPRNFQAVTACRTFKVLERL